MFCKGFPVAGNPYRVMTGLVSEMSDYLLVQRGLTEEFLPCHSSQTVAMA